MKSWTKLGVPFAAIALLIGGSAAAYAAAGIGSAPPERERNIRDAGASLAICAEGASDCQDTIVTGCTETAECENADEACPPETACIEPWLMNPPICPDDVPIDVCYPNARPLMPYVCASGDGEAFDCTCLAVPAPAPGGIAPEPRIEPLPEGVNIACPPVCGIPDAPCEPPCGPLPLPPVGFDSSNPTEPGLGPDAPVILPIECPPFPCVPGPAIDCAPLPCDLPQPLPEPLEPQEYLGPPCVAPAPCPDPLPEAPTPELRDSFPCLLPPDGCITYPDGSGACSGSGGAIEPTIVEPAP